MFSTECANAFPMPSSPALGAGITFKLGGFPLVTLRKVLSGRFDCWELIMRGLFGFANFLSSPDERLSICNLSLFTDLFGQKVSKDKKSLELVNQLQRSDSVLSV